MRLRGRAEAAKAQWFPTGSLMDALRRPMFVRLRRSMLVVWAFTFPEPQWRWLVVIVLGAIEWALTRLARSQVSGIRLDDAGIHEIACWRTFRLHRWRDIRSVSLTGGYLTVCSDAGLLLLPRGRPEVEALAREVQRRWQPETSRDERSTPDRIAQWLGIERDGSLLLKPPPVSGLQRLRNGLVWMVLLCALVLGVEFLLRRNHEDLLYFELILVAVFGLPALWDAGPMEATVNGLRSRRWSLSWDAISDCTWVRGKWRLLTERGPIWIRGPEADRVAETIDRILDARFSGAVLPRMTDIPDHALSRAESAEVSAERGISPAGDEP